MRKIILSMAVSLDGYFEGPERQIDWHRVDDELHGHFNDWLRGMGAFLEGRVTYEQMEGFWPTADRDPNAGKPTVEFAGIWRDMPKIVYSRTLREVGPNAIIKREVVPEEIMAMKAEPGGDLVVGGADLAAAFRRHGLIDEYRIYVNPVLLGRGRPLFPPGDDQSDLRLVESRTFGNGVIMLRYEIMGAGDGESPVAGADRE